MIVAGALIALAGIVLLPLPGPGMLVIALGALLVAEESLSVAKALDALERRARPFIERWRPLQRSDSR
ncbi:MAG TPA: PGPGW domain-containing protein [Burkholderiales bacterium]|nr:PGPGW domain-containing protein [Burkholderiales bacterium]